MLVSVACGTDVIESALDRTTHAAWAEVIKGGKGMKRSVPRTPYEAWWQADSSKKERNRRASGQLSPTFWILRTRLHISSVSPPLPQKQHINPPIPLFKIPPAEWPSVLQRVAQGESLRQFGLV